MSQFLNKSIVITGGCSGIGYEVARQMLIQGAKVSERFRNAIEELQIETLLPFSYFFFISKYFKVLCISLEAVMRAAVQAAVDTQLSRRPTG